MELTQEEIQANIERLRNRVGDARTGGKGSQRRKVKVVTKTAVIILSIRLEAIKLSRTSSRKLELILLESMRSTSSEMTTPSFTLKIPKVLTLTFSLCLNSKQHFHCQWRTRNQNHQRSSSRHYPTTWPQATQTSPRFSCQSPPNCW